MPDLSLPSGRGLRRLYPGAHEMREMFDYFSAYTYFGPKHEAHIAAANALVPDGFTSFADWARANMKPS